MGLSAMVSDLMQRVREFFKPYTLEDYIKDNEPRSIEEVEALERSWLRTVAPQAWPKF